MGILLLLVGCICVAASFFIPSDQEGNKENENVIINYENREVVDHSTSEKLMAINEYSDFVLQEIEKKHKELLFMYQLINEKETTVKQNKQEQTAMDTKDTENNNVEEEKYQHEQRKEKLETLKQMVQQDVEDNLNNNHQILSMYQNGHTIKEIAKTLGLGIGEVKLVIDLFKEVSP
jgi:small-conductance mechanosensitive channel